MPSSVIQDDWVLDLTRGLAVSRLTTDVRWPRLTRRLAELIKSQAGREASILDIGAGHGDFHELLRGGCRSYVGIEPSRSAVGHFQPDSGKSLCRGYGEQLPFSGESFDAVVIKAALDHCFDPDLVLSESLRVLKRGGRIFVLLTNDAAWYKRILNRVNQDRKRDCFDHNFFFSAGQLASMLTAAGFTGTKILDFDYLRLPGAAENAIMKVASAASIISAMDLIDRLGQTALPGSGGTFIAVGTKLT